MFGWFNKKEAPKVIEIKYTPPEISEDEIDTFTSSFQNLTGITFDTQRSILKSKLLNICRQYHYEHFNTFFDAFRHDHTIQQEVVNYLTTNETYFYREFQQIAQLVSAVQEVPHPVSILCAPSSTGEEPYSIAIALLEAGVASSRFSITGIDINSEAVDQAIEASYKARNVRNLSPDIISQYFTHIDERYQLKPEVKALVHFSVMNIFDSSFAEIGTFDFVFSRNMLIYFDKETKLKAKAILEALRKNPETPVFFGHADLF